MPLNPSHCGQKLLALGVSVVLMAWLAAPGFGQIIDRTNERQADLIITNAMVWTGVEGEPLSKRPQAIAIRGGKIIAIGPAQMMLTRTGAQTEIVDVGGRRVIPGFTDSHVHIIGGGLQLGRLNLRDVADKASFVEAVRVHAKPKRKSQWILGGRWSVESWADQTPPDKTWLDGVTGEVPAFLERMDGHQALVNSAALRRAKIDASGPPDPPGGQIDRDPATGEPTGILRESAMDLVRKHITKPSEPERYRALQDAMDHASRLGVTSAHVMSGPENIPVFRRAGMEKRMGLRLTVYLMADDWSANLETLRGVRFGDDWLRYVGFKGFMDGSLGSRTAYMREPYSDAPDGMLHPRGQLSAMATPPDNLIEQIVRMDAEKFQLAIHAIGDEANHIALNAFERAIKENGPRDRTLRMEHAQHLLEPDIARFAALGVVASMQPFHKADDGRFAEARIGSKRLSGAYAYRRLVDSGATVIFGSDWPVVTMDPIAGIDAAVNAKTLAGEVWLPSHSLTVEEALRAYTVYPPRAIGLGDKLGTIEVGKYADLVVLYDDLLTMPPENVGKVRVATTIVGGIVKYNQGVLDP